MIGDRNAPDMAPPAPASRTAGRPALRWLLAGLFLLALVALYGLPMVTGRAPAATTHATALVMVSDAGCGPRELRMSGPGELSVTFHNHGRGAHTLTITGVEGRVAAEPGSGIATGVFTIARRGTYTFWCAPPGQQEATMKGTLIVGTDTAAGR